MRRLGLVHGSRNTGDPGSPSVLASPPERALAWVRSQEIPGQGIRVHSGRSDAYPEVTGYLIPTLIRYGERELARRLVRWLVEVQRADGSYASPEGPAYAFDTGQALRGLFAGAGLVPDALHAARRAAEYLYRDLVDGGSAGFRKRYWYAIPETVQLHILRPLHRAADVFGKPEYRLAAENCLRYYSHHKKALRLDVLSHFLGYELEALIDLGRPDLAIPLLADLRKRQAPDGSVCGEEGVPWVCTPGLAQLAVCWYKIGEAAPADRAVAWLDAHQELSGGFRGSYGLGARYFPETELPWAAKFYLDAHLLRVAAFFRGEKIMVPRFVPKADGRARSVLSSVKPGDRVLEVGCGKGRYLRLVTDVYPDAMCVGLDLTGALLSSLPSTVKPVQGYMEALPCRDGAFDVVLSVEAIEHSANRRVAIQEMIRVTKKGGTVLVIDKDQSQWGRLACPRWERWSSVDEVIVLLEEGCESVEAEPVGYDDQAASDGLMILWHGQKR